MKWIKTKEVRKRILFTILILIIFQIGTFIPLPYIERYQTTQNSLLNLLSGGALNRFGILMLGVSPYITSSIIVSLLQKTIPSWKRKSSSNNGKSFIGQVQRYFTLFFACVQSFGLIYSGIGSSLGIVIPASNKVRVILMLLITSGALFTSYLGEKITEDGIGNGASVLIGFGIFTQIVLQVISVIQLRTAYQSLNQMDQYTKGILILVGLFVVLFYVSWKINKKEFKFPTQSLINGYPTTAHYFPIKLLASSVMPIIFATAILTILTTLNNWYQFGWVLALNSKRGLFLYASLIFVFSFIYNYLQVDGEELQEQFLQGGMYLLNYPQYQIKKFINKKLFFITLVSSPILTIFAVFSIVVERFLPEQFGLQLIGVSLLIFVGVLQEVIFQIKGLTDKVNYRGIFK